MAPTETFPSLVFSAVMVPNRTFMEFGSELRQTVFTEGTLPLELDSGSGRLCNDQGLANTKFCETISRNLRVSRKYMVGPQEAELLSVKVPKNNLGKTSEPAQQREI